MFSETTAFRRIKSLTKSVRFIAGGTSASKTISILIYLIAKAQTDNAPTLTSVVSESVPHLKRGAIRDFKKIMQSHHYWDDKRWNSSDSTYTFETGSTIEFFSADNGDKLRGGRRDRLFINEANNIIRDAFDQLEVRTKEFTICDWNPSNEFWAYELMEDEEWREDIEFITLTYKDNEALSDDIVRSIERRKNNERWWRVYGLGLLGEAEGRIYTDWSIIDEVPHEARLVRYGIDFGYSNDPTAVVAVYYYNGGYILDEIAYKKELLNKTISDIIQNQPQQALVIADSAEPKSIAEMNGYGLNIIGAEKGKDSVLNGIQAVQGVRISVTASSLNIIKEYRNYFWAKDKKTERPLNEPEHDYSHSMDAIRYALVSILNTGVATPEQEREILIRREYRQHSARSDTGL